MHCCFSTVACHLTIRNCCELLSWLSAPQLNGSLQLAPVCQPRLNTPWSRCPIRPCPCFVTKLEVENFVEQCHQISCLMSFWPLAYFFRSRVLMLAWKWVKCIVAACSRPALIWQAVNFRNKKITFGLLEKWRHRKSVFRWFLKNKSYIIPSILFGTQNDGCLGWLRQKQDLWLFLIQAQLSLKCHKSV